jgi:hypothetical protein
MKYISVVLRSVLIVTSLSDFVSVSTESGKLNLVEQTIDAIKECMESEPFPWPEEWKKEYLETIRSVVESHRDILQFSLRLEVLHKGFQTCWDDLTKNKERSLFEVYQTRMRWYTEHLMGSEFPTDRERQKLRDQYTGIWNYAADSLLEQFPFLDPNTVQKAKADDLSKCYRKIDAPLMPIYLRPMSSEQVRQIKQRWDKVRYIRVDLLRRLGNGSKMPLENSDPLSSSKECDYELTKESLSQLLGLVWTIVPERPEYYLNALENRNKALKHRIQSKRMARSDQRRMQKERSRQLLQTEHISFMLSALLETQLCFEGNRSIIEKKQISLEQRTKSSKGGGVYEIDNDSPEK